MTPHERILATNRQSYQQLAKEGAALCQIVSDEELRNPLAVIDPLDWFGGSILHKQVLCLAAGGGRQSCLYAAAGAQVTVVDLCPAMLDQDRVASRSRGFQVRLIEGSMDDLTMLDAESFDLVAHPVSTCYLPNLLTVYAQVARVLRPGGLYVSQHKSPLSLQASIEPENEHFQVLHPYYRTAPVPPPPPGPVASRLRESGATEFLHRWEQLIGGLCRAGFVIEDLVEPMHADSDASRGSFAYRANYIAPYVRIKARRKSSKPPSLWLP